MEAGSRLLVHTRSRFLNTGHDSVWNALRGDWINDSVWNDSVWNAMHDSVWNALRGDWINDSAWNDSVWNALHDSVKNALRGDYIKTKKTLKKQREWNAQHVFFSENEML